MKKGLMGGGIKKEGVNLYERALERKVFLITWVGLTFHG